jgi:hypothetical protein
MWGLSGLRRTHEKNANLPTKLTIVFSGGNENFNFSIYETTNTRAQCMAWPVNTELKVRSNTFKHHYEISTPEKIRVFFENIATNFTPLECKKRFSTRVFEHTSTPCLFTSLQHFSRFLLRTLRRTEGLSQWQRCVLSLPSALPLSLPESTCGLE